MTLPDIQSIFFLVIIIEGDKSFMLKTKHMERKPEILWVNVPQNNTLQAMDNAT